MPRSHRYVETIDVAATGNAAFIRPSRTLSASPLPPSRPNGHLESIWRILVGSLVACLVVVLAGGGEEGRGGRHDWWEEEEDGSGSGRAVAA